MAGRDRWALEMSAGFAWAPLCPLWAGAWDPVVLEPSVSSGL